MKAGKIRKPKGRPKFDHKTGGVSRLPDLLTDWFGAHKAGVVSASVAVQKSATALRRVRDADS
jgi:hypothetical protein